MSLVDDVKARLDAGSMGRAVYAREVPNGALPAQYILVRETPNAELGSRMCDTTNLQDHVVRVLSVARDGHPEQAAHFAEIGRKLAMTQLRDWRPTSAYKFKLVVAPDTYADKALPDFTEVAAAQYSYREAL